MCLFTVFVVVVVFPFDGWLFTWRRGRGKEEGGHGVGGEGGGRGLKNNISLYI